MIVLDTNVLSELTKRDSDPNVVDWFGVGNTDEFWITSTTISELLLGVARMPEGQRHDTLKEHYTRIFAVFEGRTLSFESHSAEIFAELVADRFNRGRPISREDAQIAASCLATGAALATRNAKVFDETPGLTVINPWKAAG